MKVVETSTGCPLASLIGPSSLNGLVVTTAVLVGLTYIEKCTLPLTIYAIKNA